MRPRGLRCLTEPHPKPATRTRGRKGRGRTEDEGQIEGRKQSNSKREKGRDGKKSGKRGQRPSRSSRVLQPGRVPRPGGPVSGNCAAHAGFLAGLVPRYSGSLRTVCQGILQPDGPGGLPNVPQPNGPRTEGNGKRTTVRAESFRRGERDGTWRVSCPKRGGRQAGTELFKSQGARYRCSSTISLITSP